MSDPLLIAVFVAAAAVSLATSWLLVSRLERIGARFGLSEALMGLLAALAADAPEITAAVSALAGHKAQTGAGVVIGSNVFNLAALLGLATLVAGQIALHRRVIVLEALVAVPIAGVTLVVAAGDLTAGAGLAIVAAILIPYAGALGVRHDRLRRIPIPGTWRRWLEAAVREEGLEIEPAVHAPPGTGRDAVVAGLAVVVVVAVSVAMEQAASKFGARHALPQIVVGGLILAVVTSLPNAVAAIYLARRGRGAATLSTAMNSNALNVAVGLMIPGTVVGLGASSSTTVLAAAWYLGLTVVALAGAYWTSGLRRGHGAVIVCAYAAFTGLVIATA